MKKLYTMICMMLFAWSAFAFFQDVPAVTVAGGPDVPWWAPIAVMLVTSFTGILTWLAKKGFASWEKSNDEKAKTQRTYRYISKLDEVVEHVFIAVLEAVGRETALALADGKVTPAERKKIMDVAVDAAKSQLGDDWENIKERFGWGDAELKAKLGTKLIGKIFKFKEGPLTPGN